MIACLKIHSNIDLNRSIPTLPNPSITRHSKPIVGILKFRWDARSSRAAGDFQVMSPRAPARGFAGRLHRTVLGSLWIPLWRDGVVIGVIPVAAPLVHVVTNVVQAEGVGRVLRDGLRPVLPARSVMRQQLRRIISPGKLLLLLHSAHRALPLGFGWKPESASGLRTQPLAIANSFMPRHSRNGLMRMTEVWIVPERRRRARRRSQESFIFRVPD